MTIPQLVTTVAAGGARAAAVLEWLLGWAGIPSTQAGPSAGDSGSPLLWYGPDAPSDAALVIPADSWDRRPPFDPAAAQRAAAALRATGVLRVLPFDVVRATALLLDDELHDLPPAADLDAHGRLRHDASAPVRGGAGPDPIADGYVNLVAEWVAAATGMAPMPRWPNGARAAIGLSHDVDQPDRAPMLRAVLGNPLRVRAAPRTIAARARREVRSVLSDRAGAGTFWAFDDIVESEARRGFRSTFFFAATPFFAPWGSLYDVAYDIRERRFTRVFRALESAGFEVGLHTGYRAWEAPGRIALERRRLQEASGADVRGNRHHYWHMGDRPDATLLAQAAAGFAYDSSIAFNEHIGFRRSVSLPFRPFDRAAGRSSDLLEIPVFCMDGNLFYGSADVQGAVDAIAAGVDAVVRGGGSAVFDWHVQTSTPSNREFRAWGLAWQAVLDLLAARDDVWVTDLGSIDAWVRQRESSLGSNVASGAPGAHRS